MQEPLPYQASYTVKLSIGWITKQLITDGASTFDNDLMKHLTKRCAIKHIIVIPHHPQANGQVEQYNRMLKEVIAKQVNNATDEREDIY
jgi:hypothetical protein